MATEASKTKKLLGASLLPLLKGEGLDIGCGADPVLPGVQGFDQKDGDANEITKYLTKKFDFVFSSHALEHMRDPRAAIKEWFSLVRPGGLLVVIVPDEDLYEQGCFPSFFNADHTHTFTVCKNFSWSPRSLNLLELGKSLDGELVSVELQDNGYDRSLASHNPGPLSRRLGRICRKLCRRMPAREEAITKLFRSFGALVDQTNFAEPRLAQIQLVVRKAHA
jgi:SAM-dependent methyltransferase